MRVINLRTQNLNNPIGINETPVLSWKLVSDEKNKFQSAYRIVAASSEENIAKEIYDIWDSDKVISSKNYAISYAGKKLSSMDRVYWAVMVWDEKDVHTNFSETAYFEIGLLDKHDWIGQWITGREDDCAPILAKEFCVDYTKELISARLYISGLGLCETHINGNVLGENTYFNPGESDVRDTIYYCTYEIEHFLNVDEKVNTNVISFVLGNGQYSNYRIHRQSNRYYKTDDWRNEDLVEGMFGQVKGIAQIVLKYDDGTITTIGTDDTWVYTKSPITENSWYGGEDYDARLEMENWDNINPALPRDRWETAKVIEQKDIPTGRLTCIEFEPIAISEVIASEKIIVNKIKEEAEFTTYLVDVGRNGAGFLEITLETKVAGKIIKIYPAEVDIFDGYEGHINQASCTQSASSDGDLIYDTYITRGKGVETYHPRFCYHGYRYAEVVVPNEIDITNQNFRGYILRTNNPKNGGFTSSNDILNGINDLTEKSIESNMYGTFTDCPQIEKLGWLETPSLMFYSMAHTYDISSWIPKLVRDMADAQYDTGRIAAIAPEYFEIGPLREDLNWNGSIILTAWQYYENYGNKNIFSDRNYDAMKKYMNYLKTNVAKNNMIYEGQMGEWGEMTQFGRTPVVLVETTAYYRMAVCMSKIADLLGKNEDKNEYSNLAVDIKKAFHKDKECYNDEHLYGNGTQSSYGCVLFSGIVLDENREETVNRLVTTIENTDYHLTSGEVGLKQVFSALAENGRSDIIYKMVTNDTMPSYKYFLDKGLTTLPEYWNFEDLWGTVMRSRNHAMMGHVKEWFTRHLVGISHTDIGYDRISIKPSYVEAVAEAKGVVDSVHGNITVAWKHTKDKMDMSIDIPVGVNAKVYIPKVNDSWEIFVDGKEAEKKIVDNGKYYELLDSFGSGKYRIVSGMA